MISWTIVLAILIFDRCHATMWKPERTGGDQCEIAMREVIREDRSTITDDSPTRLHSTWFSQECEVRAGPEYVIRKYAFFANGTFFLLRYHYAEESCSIATHTVVARGSIQLGAPSDWTPGATNATFYLDIVHVVPLNRQVADKFSHRLNAICGPQPKWRPYVAQLVYSRQSASWYDPTYNSLQAHSATKKHGAVDCLEPLGIEFGELGLLRVQEKPLPVRSFAHSSAIKLKVELAFGSPPPNVRSRWMHKPTSLQPTKLLRIDTISDCPICSSISRGTEYNPPLLHEVAALPALLGGSWISSECESVEGGLWLRRQFDVYSGDKLWAGRWTYHADPKCTAFLYSITAAGSYIQRAGRQRRQAEEEEEVIQSRSRSKRTLKETYRHLLRDARPSMVKSFTAMLRGKPENIDRRRYIVDAPSGTTELDLHVAESILIPGNRNITKGCGGIEQNRPLHSWSRNCVPLAIEAPSTLGLSAKVGVNWNGQYTLRLGPRDDNIWDAPLRQCGPTAWHNPKLRAYLRRSLGLRYGLASSASSPTTASNRIYLAALVSVLLRFLSSGDFRINLVR